MDFWMGQELRQKFFSKPHCQYFSHISYFKKEKKNQKEKIKKESSDTQVLKK